MSDVTRLARNLISRSRSSKDRYRSLLGGPGARGFFFSAAIARLGVAMTGLGLLWTVRGLTHSFALAGAATAVFACAEAIVGPQNARLVDRYGQSRLLPPLLAVHVAGISLSVVGSFDSETTLILGGALVAGGAIPQPGALSAARWTHVLRSGDRLRTAFSSKPSSTTSCSSPVHRSSPWSVASPSPPWARSWPPHC
ncbi:hypothetical protein [Frondihabitans sucicola]|uniref:hypothetical protein n=1 Tax=Frondihabitans sucicola TaxID=1268041 RepID=UPI0025729A69|nr:hypothetical protein [Frondihabitans sucicola]